MNALNNSHCILTDISDQPSVVDRGASRPERWAVRHRRLWCIGCQSYRRWYWGAFGAVVCAMCDRTLIAEVITS
jgi:hypothetical protein